MKDSEVSVVSAASVDSTLPCRRMSEPSAISSGTGTARKSSKREPKKVGWMWLPSGTILPHLMANPGGESATSCLEDSHVKTLVTRGKGQESRKAREAVCSSNSCESLAKYDLKSSSWRTYQQSIEEGSTLFLGRFPKQGMMRNGCIYEQVKSERITDGKDGSVWPLYPTPQACDSAQGNVLNEEEIYFLKSGKPRKVSKQGVDGSVGLARYVRIQTWPTPRAKESTESLETIKARRERTGVGMMNLTAAVQTWPTPNCSDVFTDNLKSSQQKEGSMHSVNLSQKVMWPTANARDYKGGTQSMVGKCHLDSEVEFGSGTQQTNVPRLNPLWVEWLMGFPKGWTDLNASVTPWFPYKGEQPGKC